jgi:hypothetical protein
VHCEEHHIALASNSMGQLSVSELAKRYKYIKDGENEDNKHKE